MTAASLTSGRRAHSNGWWGMLLFAASETALIGSIVGSYVYLRVNTAVWPPRGIPEPSLLAPIVLTAVLLSSLVPFGFGVAAARRGRRVQALALVAAATCIQAAYFGVQIHLFVQSLARFTPQANAYASIYYLLLGAGHAHVAVGILFDLWLLARLSTRLTPYRLRALEAVGLYWIVVGGITVIVALTELSPRI